MNLPIADIAKDWPKYVGNPDNPDVVTILRFEDKNGRPLQGCRVVVQAPSGNKTTLQEGDTFRLQLEVRYSTA